MKPKAPEPAKPKAVTPAVKPVAHAPAVPSNPLQSAASAPEKPHAVAAAPPPVVLFERPEDEASEPHWIDPVTGFPDTQRRRDGSLFSTPKA